MNSGRRSRGRSMWGRLALSAVLGATVIGAGHDPAGAAEAPATLAVDSISVAEGDSGTTVATFTVTRSGSASGAVSVKARTSGGNATSGEDYTPVPLTTLSFAASETTKTVNLSVVSDSLPEGDDTVNLLLSAASGAVIADTSGTATIVNDDGAAYLGVTHVAVTEGNAGSTPVIFTINRYGNTTGASSVTYKTQDAGATAGSDYTALPLTSVTFAPGETAKTVVVNVLGDTADELNEPFKLVLTSAVGATIADGNGNCYITDDDGPIAPGPVAFIAANNVIVNEGDGGSTPVTFTITRYGSDLSGSNTLKARTSGGNATAGVDYIALPSTTVTFGPGETSRTLTVQVAGDTLPEGNETFSLTLSGLAGAEGAKLADTSGTATVVNDDGAAYISVDNAWLTEGDSGTTPATFTLTRSGNTTGTSTVKVRTAGGNAVAGTDYVALALTDITFAPSETTKTVAVGVLGDNADEANETFTLQLSLAAGATIADNAATATIADDD